MRLLLVVVLFAQASTLASQKPGPDPPAQHWVDDMHSKNLTDILAMYIPDAVFTDSDGHRFSDPHARSKLFESVFATYDSDLKLTIKSNIKTNPQSDIQLADYHEDLRTRATGKTAVVCGTVVFVWKRQSNGAWLIANQRWTSSDCSKERHAVNDLPTQRWLDDMRSGNIDDLLALCSPHALLTTGEMAVPPFNDPSYRQKYFEQLFAHGAELEMKVEFPATSPSANPRTVSQMGTYSQTVVGPVTGKPTVTCGSFITGWSRQPDGQWLLLTQSLTPNDCRTHRPLKP